MFIATIFLVLLVAMVFIWQNKRNPAIYSFLLSFGLAIMWFLHHITDVIGLSL